MTTSATTHCAEIHAWLPKHADLDGLFDSKPERIAAVLLYSDSGPDDDSYWKKEGYTYVGTAKITVTVGKRDEIVANKVASLRASQQAISAEAAIKVRRIDTEIQTLLAITHEPRTEGGAS